MEKWLCHRRLHMCVAVDTGQFSASESEIRRAKHRSHNKWWSVVRVWFTCNYNRLKYICTQHTKSRFGSTLTCAHLSAFWYISLTKQLQWNSIQLIFLSRYSFLFSACLFISLLLLLSISSCLSFLDSEHSEFIAESVKHFSITFIITDN